MPPPLSWSIDLPSVPSASSSQEKRFPACQNAPSILSARKEDSQLETRDLFSCLNTHLPTRTLKERSSGLKALSPYSLQDSGEGDSLMQIVWVALRGKNPPLPFSSVALPV